MFGFDMLVHGVRGDQLPQDENLTEEEIEVYGIDWAALQDEQVLHSVHAHNSNEGSTSWIGHTGPPAHLNEVQLEAPITSEIFDTAEMDHRINNWAESQSEEPEELTVASIWVYGLAVAHMMYGDIF